SSLFLVVIRALLHLPPFPYTTLFRSDCSCHSGIADGACPRAIPDRLKLPVPTGFREPHLDLDFGIGYGRDRGRDAAKRREFLERDRKSTRLNSSHQIISYAVFCLKKK